jgi:isopenicillin-N epimerase
MSVAKTGYQAFGSFHTENVDELLARDLSALPSNPHLTVVPPPGFGISSRSNFFIDFDKWTFVNHGAFGAVLRPAMQESQQWRE